MYKILINVSTTTGNKWLFYQEDGVVYTGNSLDEIKDTALMLLKKYGRKSIKIIKQTCEDLITYVYGDLTTETYARIIDLYYSVQGLARIDEANYTKEKMEEIDDLMNILGGANNV